MIVPRQEKRKVPVQIKGFESPIVNMYSIETTLAEKLDAILSLLEFSSRMKDYYDIYSLAHKFDFDGAVLAEALRSTFENRERSFTMEAFEQISAFSNSASMNQKWKAFIRKINRESESFSLVLEIVEGFLLEPFVAAIEKREFNKQWSSINRVWC